MKTKSKIIYIKKAIENIKNQIKTKNENKNSKTNNP
jgi:hypothetical protein